MIPDRYSLHRRLTVLYTLAGAIVLTTIGVALIFVVFFILTRPAALELAQTVRNVESAAVAAPASESTAAIETNILRSQRRSGFDLIGLPADALRNAFVTRSLGEFSVAGLFGLPVHSVVIRDAAIIIIPKRSTINSLLRTFEILVLSVVVGAIVGERVVAGVLRRKSLAPLRTVIAELERYVSSDFKPRPLAITDPTELGEFVTAYNAAVTKGTEAFFERRRVEDHMRQFVTDAGHELRTPLTVIAGYVDVLRRGSNVDATIREAAFASLTLEIKRMRTLVERLMTLARLDSRVETQPESVDVGTIVRQAVNALAVMSDVLITVEVSENVLVLGEPGDLYEAVSNLLENAMKYGEHSGISVTVGADGPEVAVRVTDGGPGIAERHRARIFERFYRATEDTTVMGSGLGLAIAEKAVQRLNGRLVLEDAQAGSTTFALVMPAMNISIQKAAQRDFKEEPATMLS